MSISTTRAKSKLLHHEACPECQKSGRDNSSNNKGVYDDGHGYCFACETYYPKSGISSISDEFTYQYLDWRGINKGVYEFYNSRFKIDAEGKPTSLGFMYPNGSIKVRQFGEKAFHTVGDIAKSGLFGSNKFAAGSHKYVIITEGELDALSYYQVLRQPVVSVRSSSSAKLDAANSRSFLNSFERIYLAFDGDDAGRSAASSVAKLFDYNKVYDIRFPGGNRKDANDYVRAGEDGELRNIFANAKRFLPDNIISARTEFEKIMREPLKVGVPVYPSSQLNWMTGGMRTGEVVLLTAQEGVGKTHVSHSVLYNLLKETNDNVGAIFLEESKQRLLQALAGIHLKKPVHLPEFNGGADETIGAITELVPVDDRLHIYSHFGSDDPETLLDSIRFLVAARGCRWVVFDLISLAVAGLGGEKERESLDYLSARLEVMTQELDFGILEVSHVNDFGQTRGSRMIGKNCHIRIDLDRDIKSGSLVTDVTISKNRPTSRTGSAGQLIFDPLTHILSEHTDGKFPV